MPKLTASLSIDLDNKWAYLKTHGDEQWSSYPSYLGVVIPRILSLLDEFGLQTTFFVVGQDAMQPKNHQPLLALAEAGHEIANHSFQHDPWLHRYSPQQLEDDLSRTEACLRELTGQHPVGFRGPGFSHSIPLLRLLAERGYEYECSTFPTFVGPLARLYYFAVSRDLSADEREERKQLFGDWKQGFRPLRPYRWSQVAPSLIEIPVTTMPFLRTPIHLSYLHYLASYSSAAATAYFKTAMGLCRMVQLEPSILLHPLDFLGQDDEPDLAFFPGMRTPHAPKLDRMRSVLGQLSEAFDVVPMREHARRVAARTPESKRESQQAAAALRDGIEPNH